MGMKKSSALGLIGFAMAMSSATGLDVFDDGTKQPTPKLPPTKMTPFKKQDGIVRLIKEYNLIQKGECKKGKRKQLRTVSKINEMIKKGYLTNEDLK